MDRVECPLCLKLFPLRDIEEHANACLEGLGQPDSTENNDPEAMSSLPLECTAAPLVDADWREEEAHPTELDPLPTSLDSPMASLSSGDVSADEDVLLAETLRKIAEQDRIEEAQRKEAEERDRKLAMELWANESGGAKAPPPHLMDEDMEYEGEEKDRLFALALVEEERRKEDEARGTIGEGGIASSREQEDRLLALALMEEERQAEEETRRVKEKQADFDRVVSLVKEEAQTEADRKLAVAMREEELERRLAEAEFKATNIEMTHTAPGLRAHVTLRGIEYPPYWAAQTHPFEVFDVPSHSEEHRGVVAAERDNDSNERFMFHGSRATAYDTITSDGFDHRVANLGGAIGAGVYFATHASTSTSYLGGSSRGGLFRMLYCRVTLGDIGKGKVGIRRPPEKSKGVLYHSVGRLSGGNGMAVVFDNFQAYPEYIIHFRM